MACYCALCAQCAEALSGPVIQSHRLQPAAAVTVIQSHRLEPAAAVTVIQSHRLEHAQPRLYSVSLLKLFSGPACSS
jgi:hypothetical protein